MPLYVFLCVNILQYYISLSFFSLSLFLQCFSVSRYMFVCISFSLNFIYNIIFRQLVAKENVGWWPCPAVLQVKKMGKPQKSSFFNGPTTKALSPPPLSLVATLFWGIFLGLQKKLFFLVARPLPPLPLLVAWTNIISGSGSLYKLTLTLCIWISIVVVG